jgi:hypothetical protein
VDAESLVRSFSLFQAFLWTLAGVGIFVAGLTATAALRPEKNPDLITVALWDAVAFGAVAVALGYRHAGARGSRDLFGFRLTHPLLSALGLGLGVTLHGPADTLGKVVDRFAPPSEAELVERAAALGDLSPGRGVALIVVVACVGPLMEEAFFRGALFGALRRSHSAAVSVVVTSVCFAVSHQELRVWAPSLLAAFALGFFRHASGSVLPCLALHVTFNAVMLAPVLTGLVPAHRPFDLGSGLAMAGWVLSAMILWVARRVALASPEAERARAEDAHGT